MAMGAADRTRAWCRCARCEALVPPVITRTGKAGNRQLALNRNAAAKQIALSRSATASGPVEDRGYSRSRYCRRPLRRGCPARRSRVVAPRHSRVVHRGHDASSGIELAHNKE
jgi:hypothetical protein